MVRNSSVRYVVQVKECHPGSSLYMIVNSLETRKRQRLSGAVARVGLPGKYWQQLKQVARGT